MVITGASAGIGRATAVRLARDGAALVICARRRAPLEAAADEIRGAGGEVLAVTADVTREAEMDALVASAVDRFGRLDVMMCNAGFGIYGSIDQIEAGAHAAAARRELHGHVPGGTRRAARLPPPAERSVDHRLVDRRQARHSVHGGVCRHEVRPGRPGRVAARRASRLGHPRDRRLPDLHATPNSST